MLPRQQFLQDDIPAGSHIHGPTICSWLNQHQLAGVVIKIEPGILRAVVHCRGDLSQVLIQRLGIGGNLVLTTPCGLYTLD